MTAGGVLASGGGVLLLIDQRGYLPPSLSPIGDLCVPVAVLLCGGWTLRGWPGALLAGVLLPVGYLAATLWYQQVWYANSLPVLGPPFEPSLLALAIAVLAIQLLEYPLGLGRWRRVGGWLAIGGVLLAATGAFWRLAGVAACLRYAGGALWVVGVAIAWIHRRRWLRSLEIQSDLP